MVLNLNFTVHCIQGLEKEHTGLHPTRSVGFHWEFSQNRSTTHYIYWSSVVFSKDFSTNGQWKRILLRTA